jgi:Cd2+/Zn2+-exporting ATPase
MAHHHQHEHCEHCAHEHHHEHGEHHHEHGEHHHEHEEHHHEHEEHSLRSQLTLIVVTVLLLAAAMLVEKHATLTTWQLLLVYLVPYLVAGHDTLREAAEGIAHGDWFNEHFLMSVATIGALAIGFLPDAEPQMAEAVFVMLFFQVGELFEGYAEGKSRQSISHLMDIRPDVAYVEATAPQAPPSSPEGDTNVLKSNEAPSAPLSSPEGDTNVLKSNEAPSGAVGGAFGASVASAVHPDDVGVGSIIVVRPGEKVPLDGVIIEGSTSLNTVALTGESAPREAAEGDEVLSGCINLSGVIRVRTTKTFGQSTVSKIISLVESATEHKSKSETFITRFARVYTPVVVVLALLIAILPPLFISLTSHLSPLTSFSTWAYRALLFLVVSCPCALVISVPLTFFGGIGGASRKGILIKGANYIDALAEVDTVVFDKTGTLTEGEFAVSAIHPDTCNEHQLLHLAAHVEHYSTHPIGAALRAAFPEEGTDGCTVTDVEEVAGQGIRARINNNNVCVGNTKMMDAVGARWRACHHVGTIIHVAECPNSADERSPKGGVGAVYLGHIVINDRVKADSREAIDGLRSLGVSRMVMLTGDRQDVAKNVAEQLGIGEWHAELLPADKVELMKQVTASRPSSLTSHPSKTAFVGDGINDAPVLALADVGIAMGAMGSDAAIEAADVVLMDDRPSKLPLAIRIARRTLRIARQNVWLAIGVKVAVLLLAVVGLATMWMAVFADVGVTVLAVLNAMRALR